MKEIWVKDLALYNEEIEGAQHYVDYETYISACQAIDKQDKIIDNLLDIVKEHAKTSLHPAVKSAATDLIIKVAQLRG